MLTKFRAPCKTHSHCALLILQNTALPLYCRLVIQCKCKACFTLLFGGPTEDFRTRIRLFPHSAERPMAEGAHTCAAVCLYTNTGVPFPVPAASVFTRQFVFTAGVEACAGFVSSPDNASLQVLLGAHHFGHEKQQGQISVRAY